MVAQPHSVLPTPEAVICDLDGTLVDTVPTRITAWLTTFAEFDIPADRDHVASLIGSDGTWLAERVAERAGRELAADAAEAIDRRAGAVYGDLNTDPRPLPGVGRFLDAVTAAGLPWAVATSSRPQQVRASLAALRRPKEPIVIDGQAVARAKPEPDLLLAAAERLATAPSACWCVGDSRWDMLAAVAAGMTPIAVTTGAATDADLRDAGARLVVARIDELVDQIPAQAEATA
ncbi:MAG TPA: HAD family phosphatase [Candidatus Limnocylindria bacterium]|jgi:HAD superfamily hydrolase (TIGR01509 family)